MKIALVTPIMPVPHDQTRGRYIYETARSLARIAQVRVFFQTSRYPRLPGMKPRSYIDGQVGGDYRLPDVDIETFDYPAIPIVSRRFNGLVSSHVLGPRVRAYAPDVVLAYWVYPDGYAGLRVARALGVPCIVGALGSDIHVRDGVSAMLTRKTIAGSDALITVSEAMRQTAIEAFGADPAKVHTVVNGFNTSIFGPADQAKMRSELGIPLDQRLVVYVGRFVEAKGMRELVTAMTVLAGEDTRVHLALIGDGVMKDELHAMIQASGLRSRVHLPGGVAPAQVAKWINASDLLTLPSWSEGYPNVVVEALACGRPVVATDVGGTREIVNAGNGLLIPPRNAKVLADALRAALHRSWNHADIARSMRRSWDDVARETLDICQSLATAQARHMPA